MADEIGEALQRVASASENSNISLEKSASWLATISSITRESASTIGRSLNSVISRYESIKKTGFNEEDATKLNDVVLALSQVGIKATDSQGQLLDFADVLDTVGAKFGSLEKNEKAYIATTLFGTFQRNRGITLLNNYNDSLKNYENALNSAGASEQKFAIYQESSAAKLDKLKTSVEDFWQSTLDSSLIKGTLDALSYLIDAFGNLSTIMVSLVSVLALWKGTQITTTAVLWATSIRTLNVSLADNIRYMIIAKGEALGWTTAQVNAAIATNGLRLAINGLKTAFLSNPLGILAVALTSGILLFDIFKQKQEENAREAEQVAQKLNQEQESLSGLKGEYDKIIASGNLTAESKSRLKGIQEQLIKTYGIEAKGLDLVNGKYQDQIALINKIVAEKAKEQLVSMGTSGEEALAKSTNVSSSQFTAGWFKTNYATEVKSLLDSMVGESLGESTKKKDIFEINGTLEERVSILKNLKLELDGVANKDSQTKTLIKDVTDEYNKLNNELKANQTVLNKYIENKNVVDFYDQFKNDISEVNNLMAQSSKNPSDTGVSKQLSDLHTNMLKVADSKGRLGDFKSFIDEMFGGSDKAQVATENTDAYASSLKKLQETMASSSTNIANISSALKEYNEEGSFNLDSLIKLSEKHQQLIPILGDEAKVHEELTKIIQEEQEKSKQAYIAMLNGSVDFYNKNLEGIQTMVKGLDGARNADLSGAKTLAEAKLQVELALIKNLASLWSDYYDAQSGAFTGEFENVAGKKVVSGGINGESTAVSDAMSTQLQAYKEQANKAKQEFDKIALKGTSGIDFSKLGMSKDKDKKEASSSVAEQVSIEASLIKSYSTQVNQTIEAGKLLEKEIATAKSAKDVNTEMSKTSELIKNQTLQITQQGEVKNKLEAEFSKVSLQSGFKNTSLWHDNAGEVTLFYQEQWNKASVETQKQMSVTQDKLSKIQKAWSDTGNSINETTQSQTTLQSSIKELRSTLADDAISSLKSSLELEKDLVLKTIDEEKNALEKAHQAKLDQLDEEYNAIEKVINAKIKSIDLEKSNEDYSKKLSTAQKDAQDIQSKINVLSLDNSIEAKSSREELSKQLFDKQNEISEMQNDHDIELRKKNLQDQLDANKTVNEAQKKLEDTNYKISKDALEKTAKDRAYDFDLRINDERYFAKMRLDVVNGNITDIEAQIKKSIDNIKTYNNDALKQIGVTPSNVSNTIDKLTTASNNLSAVSKKNVYGNPADIELAKTVPNASKFNFITVNGDASQATSNDLVLGGTGAIPAGKSGQGERISGWTAEDTFELFRKRIASLDTGGLTPSWGSRGKIGILHEEELVLNKLQTSDILKVMDISKQIISNFKLPDFSNIKFPSVSNVTSGATYNLNLNIESLNGTKSDANVVFNTIVQGLKKMGVP